MLQRGVPCGAASGRKPLRRGASGAALTTCAGRRQWTPARGASGRTRPGACAGRAAQPRFTAQLRNAARRAPCFCTHAGLPLEKARAPIPAPADALAAAAPPPRSASVRFLTDGSRRRSSSPPPSRLDGLRRAADDAALAALEAPQRLVAANGNHLRTLGSLLQAATTRRAELGRVTPQPWHHGGDDAGASAPPDARTHRRRLFSPRQAQQPVRAPAPEKRGGGVGGVLLLGGLMAVGVAASSLLFRAKPQAEPAAEVAAPVKALPALPPRAASPNLLRPRGPSPARERTSPSSAPALPRSRPPTPPVAPPPVNIRREMAFTATVRARVRARAATPRCRDARLACARR